MTTRDEEIILEEARRAIDVQVASVDEVRSRTGLLLATAAVTISILGSVTASSGGLGVLGFVAVGFFVAAVFCCLVVLRPREGAWTVVTSPRILIKDWIDTDRPEESLAVFLAESLEENYETNELLADFLFAWFQRAATCVGIAVFLGVVQLAINNG
jgi:hypothetical protein